MNILETIVARKHQEIAALPPAIPTGQELRQTLEKRGGARPFFGPLQRPRVGRLGLIAEVKKASPSAGIIRADFEPVAIANAYEAGGADCLSILTDRDFFQGSREYLREIRSQVSRPLLRKDFIVDPRQIREAIEWGADAILLIVAILPGPLLAQLHSLALEAGLEVLVEVHDEAELERALAIDARLIGVNNRDLRTFKVDLGTTEKLAATLQPELARGQILLVAESGIHTRADVRRLEACGAGAILVGESLMREDDMGAKIRALLLDA